MRFRLLLARLHALLPRQDYTLSAMLTQAKSKARKSAADAPKKDQPLWRLLLFLFASAYWVLDLKQEPSEYEYYSYYSPSLICTRITQMRC